MEAKFIEYFRELQSDVTVRPLLEAFGNALSEQLGVADARIFAKRVGQSFAEARPLGNAATLEELQNQMNRFWSQYKWGEVSLEETSGALRILHHFSPLVAALGEKSAPWSPAFLEGVYQHWFSGLRLDSRLAVKQTSEVDVTGSVEYRLERSAPVQQTPARASGLFR